MKNKITNDRLNALENRMNMEGRVKSGSPKKKHKGTIPTPTVHSTRFPGQPSGKKLDPCFAVQNVALFICWNLVRGQGEMLRYALVCLVYPICMRAPGAGGSTPISAI